MERRGKHLIRSKMSRILLLRISDPPVKQMSVPFKVHNLRPLPTLPDLQASLR